MLLELLKNLLFFVLHVENSNSFPKPLSKADEEKYFKLMAQGDKGARNKLIEHNMRLAAHIAKKYSQSASEQEELLSVGTIGLIKAVSTFDYEKGAKFIERSFWTAFFSILDTYERDIFNFSAVSC